MKQISPRCLGFRAGKFLFALLGVCLLWHLGASRCSAEEHSDDHNALRELLVKTTQAINAGNFEALSGLTTPGLLITTADQRVSKNFDEFRDHFRAIVGGSQTPLRSITFHPVADDLTRFLSEDVGVVSGTSTDEYVFNDGDTRTMQSRWTATVVRENGAWRLAACHFGVDIMNNPIITALTDKLIWVALLGVAVGLALGILVRGLFRKQPPAARIDG